MAELVEVILFVVIGIVVGIVLIFIVMQSRVPRKAQQLYDSRRQELEGLYEQRKGELETSYNDRLVADVDKAKAEYKLEHQGEVDSSIKAAVEKALNSSRSSTKGKITEQLSPFFPEFMEKYNAADARFICNPVDFIVFKNLHTWSSNSGSEPQLLEISFVEVKAGNSNLNRNERAVRDAVNNLRIKYDLLKISLDDKAANGSTPPAGAEIQ